MGRIIRHSRPDNVWLFDFPSLESLSGDQDKVLFLSERDINIIYQGLKDVDRYIGRVFVSSEGNLYTSVDNIQFETFKAWISDLFNSLGDWRMSNLLLERIAIAVEGLESQPCCPSGGGFVGVGSGSRGAGVVAEPLNPFEETPEETPPDGFDTWAEYRAHKCNAAYDIVLHLKVDLLSLSNLDYSAGGYSAIITLLVATLLSPIPGDELAVLVGLLLLAAIEYSWLSSLSAQVQIHADDLACSVYTADDASIAQAALRSAMADVISGMAIPAAGMEWLNSVTEALTPADVLNNAFTPGPTETTGSVCTGCGELEPVYLILFDPLDVGDTGGLTRVGDSYTLTSTFNAGRHAVCVNFVSGPVGSEVNACGTFENYVSNSTNPSGYQDAIYYCGNSFYTVTTTGSALEAEDICVGALVLQSTTAFTCTLDVVGPCAPP